MRKVGNFNDDKTSGSKEVQIKYMKFYMNYTKTKAKKKKKKKDMSANRLIK